MQGFNMGRYVPPEHEGLVSTPNALAKKHPLGARASKLKTEGILTVRFEMPFAVWCDNCKPQPTIIGQGVRFNAAKKTVGRYYSSPIYSFRMKHGACGGELEIRTDPKNTAYVVVSGGRRRDTGDDKTDRESLVATGETLLQQRTPREQAEARESAFANLEKTIEDRTALAAASARIDELGEVAARQWDDPYARNQALRKSFRVGRKQREGQAAVTEELAARMGLGIELLPESEEDARRAALVDFGSRPAGEHEQDEKKVLARPLYGDSKTSKSGSEVIKASKGKPVKKLKSEAAAERTRQALVSEIASNRRLASDPFLEPRNRDSPKSSTLLPGLKRKRSAEAQPITPQDAEEKLVEEASSTPVGLVDYDSD